MTHEQTDRQHRQKEWDDTRSHRRHTHRVKNREFGRVIRIHTLKQLEFEGLQVEVIDF